MGIFDKLRGGTVRVHLLLRGRIGERWQDVDQHLRVPVGTTLTALILAADRAGFELTSALSNSPHLADTLMINGERCPVSEHGDRVMLEGDQVYLLAPIAGG
jgi:molybdopterin converting factor small subunit